MEKGIKKWEMVMEKDLNEFGMQLLMNSKVSDHSIFIIPCNTVAAIWVQPQNHKSNRVDFLDFFEDFGTKYKAPKPTKETNTIAQELHERKSYDTKYGWISPDGRYFHCEYMGHAALADKICYGMVDTSNSEEYLESHGWCKIYKTRLKEKYHVYIGGEHTITDPQMKTLIRLGLEDAEDLSRMLIKE